MSKRKGRRTAPAPEHELIAKRRQALLDSFTRLPRAEQITVYAELGKQLGGDVPSEQLAIADERARALGAMQAAARYIGAATAADVTVKEFDRAWRELGSEWRARHVTRIFGRWNTAKALVLDQQPQRSLDERDLIGAAGTHRRTGPDEHIADIRVWLDTDPESESVAAYRRFRQRFNASLESGQRPLVSAAHAQAYLGLSWPTIKSIARGEADLAEELGKVRSQQAAAGSVADLVNAPQAAAILGKSTKNFDRISRERGFPVWAARLSKNRLWHRNDVEAYAAGERDPARFQAQAEGELTPQLIARHELAQLLALDVEDLRYFMRRQLWERVPEPAGQFGTGGYYWWREDLERWEEERRGQSKLARKTFRRTALTHEGFAGWVTFDELRKQDFQQVPERTRGIYLVWRPGTASPRFRASSPAGWFQGRNPTVSSDMLKENWVQGAQVLYIGKADWRRKGRHPLRTRLKEYAAIGAGDPREHWGGRLIWQLADSESLLVAWRPTPDSTALSAEKDFLARFRRAFGQPPFANVPDRRGR